MTADVEPYGQLPDGRPVRRVRLGHERGLQVDVLEFGAILAAIHAPVASGPSVQVLLGYDDLDGWLQDRSYHGRLLGRVANRIAGAQFELDSETWRLTANQGPNTLHGGAVGWGGRLWRIEDASADRAVLAYVSPDGEEGFPGEVRARAAFRILDGHTLEIAWEARTERPTPVAMSQHPYFNLTGRPRTPVLDHTLQIAADAVLPVRAGLIPTGEELPVARTPFDLRQPARIGDRLAMQHQQLVIPRGFDLTWVLDPGRGGAPAAVLRAPETGIELQLSTDQPGLQVYSGQGLGHPFTPQGAVALEPQDFPNAINTPAFPSVILRPGERYLRRARYRFVAGERG